MPLNLKDYEMKPLLSNQEVFDLIFLETHEELTKLGWSSPKETWEKDLSHQLELNALMEQWNSWFFRNRDAGKFKVTNGMVQKSDVFQWFLDEGVLEYYESERFVIRKELYDLVKRFAKGEEDSEPTPPQVETIENVSENSFKPEGQDNWWITFKGKRLGLVKALDGMRYVSLILNQEKPIPSDQLYGFCEKPEQDIKSDQRQETIGGGQGTVDWDTINDLKKAEKVFIGEIDVIKAEDYLSNEELREALNEKEDQIEEIRNYLNKNTRPDKNTGKIKLTEFASEAKNASGRIHHALKTAYDKIRKESPELAEHLKSAIKSKNNKFSYNPPKDSLIDWDVTLK